MGSHVLSPLDGRRRGARNAADACATSSTRLTSKRRRRGAHCAWRGQARGGGSSGATVGPEWRSAGDGNSNRTTRNVMDAALRIAGTALMAHPVIDAHCPGAQGRPHPSCMPIPTPSAGLMRAFASGIADTAVCGAAERIPVMSPIPCAPASLRPTPCWIAHNVPLPSSESCRRKRPQSAAKERRTNDMRKEQKGRSLP